MSVNMTEEEAKTKVCCGPPECAVQPGHTCRGSACMAWRWSGGHTEQATTRNLTMDQETMHARLKSHPSERSVWLKPEGEPPMPPGEGWEPVGEIEQPRGYIEGVFARTWQRRITAKGRCGLAGAPQ